MSIDTRRIDDCVGCTTDLHWRLRETVLMLWGIEPQSCVIKRRRVRNSAALPAVLNENSRVSLSFLPDYLDIMVKLIRTAQLRISTFMITTQLLFQQNALVFYY
jgi:hypothetical protein